MSKLRLATVRGGAVAFALLSALWFAQAAHAQCATAHGDPVGFDEPPSFFSIECSYESGATESWTVPARVTEADFWVIGGDTQSERAGNVRATLAVVPGEIYTLEMGGNGAASSVSRDGETLFVGGGADGAAPNYATPAAKDLKTEAPRPLVGYPLNGRIYVSWSFPRKERKEQVNPPGNRPTRCIVPRLTGRRPGAARSALKAANCTVGTVTRRPSRLARRGRVVSQTALPGAELVTGAEVGFTVGRRP